MRENIINEIRRMERDYFRKYGKNGEIILMDAEAEARLTAYVVHNICTDEGLSTCFPPGITVEEIMENGIRGLDLRIKGMRVKFGYSHFCIEKIPEMHPRG
jgi:hypothetical protein